MRKPSIELLTTAAKETSVKVVACLAGLAVAASGLTGCESTSASGGASDSLSANNIIERSKTGSPKNGWVGYCLPNKSEAEHCYIEICDGSTLVSFESGHVSTNYTEVEDIINSELIRRSFLNDKVIPDYFECEDSTYRLKTTEENDTVKIEKLKISDITDTMGEHSEKGKNYIIKKETYKSYSNK